ncbi:sulfatase [Tunicatimonas pelagia]|uniref:sulfatase n=1 Tax=Tunicatimonas pelagia TaxID=931531 RepID=UPI0026650109|nr:sulfatase [Tunicatimonas pelagia]WKN46082.1 sulfatase [Tunicatimonas pelagia]
MNYFLCFSFLVVTSLFSIPIREKPTQAQNAPDKPNVLFIAVDDLRPELGCYGKTAVISPNIDRLASQGTLFNRAYCQIPVCGASRASLLTGLRPNRNRFLNYKTWADKDAPEAVTLPQHFKNNGYYTVSNGKIFHYQDDKLESWSELPWRARDPSNDWRNYVTEAAQQIAIDHGNGKGPAFEQADVPDTAYFDGKIAAKTIADLKRLKEQDQPFFLAVGFLKPHLPFNAPSRYWDLYNPQNLPEASNPFPPESAPDAAIHNFGELRNYAGIPPEGALNESMAKLMVHGYHACISYTDAQIGKLLDTLEELDLADNTIVVLWGDHGWNLEEHGLWCKHCNFETSLRAPLLIKAPGLPAGQRTEALTEFVDIYPTLCELSNLAQPQQLEGTSLVPLLSQPNTSGKEYVFSKYHEGFTVKNDRYRYTEWSKDDGEVYARMLYDHQQDSLENVNIVDLPENKEIVKGLQQQLRKMYQEDFMK